MALVDSIALEKQLDALRFLAARQEVEKVAPLVLTPEQLRLYREDRGNWELALLGLARGACIYLSPQVRDQLDPAVHVYPEKGDTAHPGALWRDAGWVYSPKPLFYVEWSDSAMKRDIDHRFERVMPHEYWRKERLKVSPVYAVNWHWTKVTSGLTNPATSETFTALWLHAFGPVVADESELLPIVHASYNEGHTIERIEPWRFTASDQTGAVDDMWNLTQWVMTLNMFMRQELLRSNPEPAPRQFRKRQVREGGLVARVKPEVHVVILRRVKHPGDTPEGHGGGGGHHEYHCQFIVSGHPRRQWYASEGVHRVIWIDPYIKGDPSKPLKTPSVTVYSARR